MTIFTSDKCQKCSYLKEHLRNPDRVEWRDVSQLDPDSLSLICMAEMDPNRLPLPLLIDGDVLKHGVLEILEYLGEPCPS